MEAITKTEQFTAKKLKWTYVEQNRKGDHICYITNLSKLKSHYPSWRITTGLDKIFDEIVAENAKRLAAC